jgi:glutamine synthetase
MTASVMASVHASGVRLIRFLYCDNGGVVRGKATHISALEARLRSGIGLTVAMQAMNAFDQLQRVEGMGPVGEIRLMPDPSTFVVLPYAPHTAALLVDLCTQEGEPWGACPRSFLKRVAQQAADMGLMFRASIENEFSLITPGDAPLDPTLCFSTAGMLAAQAVIDDLFAWLDAQGIIPEQYYPELAHGQHEISVQHAPLVAAADRQILVRETIRAAAHAHGLRASLAPKPFLDQAGNGGHVHMSAWTADGRNAFWDGSQPLGLSALGRQFIAGILEHLPAVLALTTPSVNSYQRLQPNTWSSGFRCWGPDNREAPVRVASPYRHDLAGTINLEFKPADLSSNPYLALSALVVAGLDGIRRGLDPGEPVLINPADMPEAERSARGITPLPRSLDEALDALERDQLLLDALGPALATSYLAVRRSEAVACADLSPEEIARRHRFIY